MPLEMVVLIKVVPDGKEVYVDPVTFTLNRSMATNVINPADENALEAALQLKDKHGGRVTVMTMAPPFAEPFLLECMSRGADQAVLISDKAVAGSDTYPTSLTLAAAIKKLGKVDIVFAGEKTSDSSTGHVGPGVAEFLEAELASYTRSLKYEDGYVTAERELETGVEVVRIPTPAVVTIITDSNIPRRATLRRKLDAMRKGIMVWSLNDINVPADWVGLRSSPTVVRKMLPFPRKDRKAKQIDESQFETLIEDLVKMKVINLEVSA
ncbi:MAG TPA: electron transfer flavoprotein subunit beta/FixA family protein [Thermoplasmataceae archaeon]|nr:electron transfer flavoprotein subunit beta/FixA family protein [Thermoplasmatales archaeon AK]HLH85341.1 electron transfer flavoprotein subunit beta/FixA family protein [Thermoplasmataceae archaeon]